MNPEEQACMRRSGPNCKYLTSALSYWCTNKACSRFRGTTIPGIINCPYYRPVDKPSLWWENLPSLGSCSSMPPHHHLSLEPTMIIIRATVNGIELNLDEVGDDFDVEAWIESRAASLKLLGATNVHGIHCPNIIIKQTHKALKDKAIKRLSL